MCTLDNILAQTRKKKKKKKGQRSLRCLHHEQNGSFENSLPVSAITVFAICLETISCLLFQSNSSCSAICSLFFGSPCHFAKVNLVFIVAFDRERLNLSNPIYWAFI